MFTAIIMTRRVGFTVGSFAKYEEAQDTCITWTLSQAETSAVIYGPDGVMLWRWFGKVAVDTPLPIRPFVVAYVDSDDAIDKFVTLDEAIECAKRIVNMGALPTYVYDEAKPAEVLFTTESLPGHKAVSTPVETDSPITYVVTMGDTWAFAASYTTQETAVEASELLYRTDGGQYDVWQQIHDERLHLYTAGKALHYVVSDYAGAIILLRTDTLSQGINFAHTFAESRGEVCSVWMVVGDEKRQQYATTGRFPVNEKGMYYNRQGMLCNADGTRNVFDDVDAVK